MNIQYYFPLMQENNQKFDSTLWFNMITVMQGVAELTTQFWGSLVNKGKYIKKFCLYILINQYSVSIILDPSCLKNNLPKMVAVSINTRWNKLRRFLEFRIARSQIWWGIAFTSSIIWSLNSGRVWGKCLNKVSLR